MNLAFVPYDKNRYHNPLGKPGYQAGMEQFYDNLILNPLEIILYLALNQIPSGFR